MSAEPTVEDIAAMRKDGSLRDYLQYLSGRTPAKPAEAKPAPGYTITHRGGWPLGTAATGPTPDPSRCSCIQCVQPAPVIPLVAPQVDHRQGEAA